jgi:hypothetical protein
MQIPLRSICTGYLQRSRRLRRREPRLGRRKRLRTKGELQNAEYDGYELRVGLLSITTMHNSEQILQVLPLGVIQDRNRHFQKGLR